MPTALKRVAATLGCVVAGVALLAGARSPHGASETVVLTLAERGAGTPTVAVDASGTAFVAWSIKQDTVADVFLTRIERGVAGKPVRINDTPGDGGGSAQTPPQVLTAPNGVLYVVWHRQRPQQKPLWPATTLRIARSTDGGRTFAPATTINDDAAGMPTNHSYYDAAVAPDGGIYVSWLDRRETDRVLRKFMADSTAGRATQRPVIPGTELRVAHSADGGASWTSAILDRNTCVCCRTALAVGPDGSVYAAWRSIPGGNLRDVAVARSTDGGRTFSAPILVHQDNWNLGGCPDAGPGMAVDARGRVHVAWYTGAENRAGAWYAMSNDGARTFGEPQRLLDHDWAPVTQVKVGTVGNEVWVAFEDRLAEPARVLLATGGLMGGLKTRAEWTQTGLWPEVAATSAGPVVTWLDDEAVRVAVPAPSR